MKPLVCIYCEGNDTKIAVISKDKDKITVHRAGSFDFVSTSFNGFEGISNLSLEGDEDNLLGASVPDSHSIAPNSGVSSVALINASLQGINLSKHLFIPGLTEPSIYFHLYEGLKNEKDNKLTQEILTDIKSNKNVNIAKDSMSYVELADNSLLSVFLSEEIPCVHLINAIARANGKRYYKIPTIKSADISLAYYVAKRKKFFPDDNSLIVYIGKEYSKLIFLQGKKLKHIGSTLDIGTVNLHTYDVYFSKILLEMENGGISSLDNIVVCGEDDSENLILSFYGTFPEANVTRMEFDDLDLSPLDEPSKEIFSSFTVPVAIAVEYFDELEGNYKGIHLLPKHIKDEQKFFQFAWHGYAILPLLFAAALLITLQVLKNGREISDLDIEISTKSNKIAENQQILNRISQLEYKINGFGQTQAILDSASKGAGVWSEILSDVSAYVALRKNLWISKAESGENNILTLEGYSFGREALTELAYKFPEAQIKSLSSETLRERTLYKFILIFNYNNYQNK